MQHKYGQADRFVYDGDDALERLVALAWDAARGRCGPDAPEVKFEILLAVELAQLVQKIASSSRSALYVSQLGLAAMYDNKNLQGGLSQAHGICGNHSDIFLAAMELLGIPARAIGVFYVLEDRGIQNHAATEFFAGGKWRFIDVTWGAIWCDAPLDLCSMLSFDEVLELSKGDEGKRRLCNQLDGWYGLQFEAGLNPFAYLHASQYLALIKGEAGYVKYELEDGKVDITHLPKYIGARTQDGGDIEARFTDPTREEGAALPLAITVSGIGGKDTKRLRIVDDTDGVHTLAKGRNKVLLRNGATVRVQREEGEKRIVVFSGISLAQTWSTRIGSFLGGCP